MSYFMREAEGLQDKKILWESGDRSIIFSFSLSHPITEIPHTFFVHHGFLAVQITNNGVDTEKVKTLKKKKKKVKNSCLRQCTAVQGRNNTSKPSKHRAWSVCSFEAERKDLLM